MMVIAPHHSDEVDDNEKCPMNNTELYKDEWYDKDQDITHQIWYCWLDGELDDETKIPDRLLMTLLYFPWSDGFREEMNDFFESKPKIATYSKEEVTRYLDWIDFWKEKGAKFYLSM